MAALRAGLITVAILLGLGFAVAQQGENLASPQQKGQQEKAQQTEPGRAGTTEPGSHTPTAPPDASWVFQNGRLITPGAVVVLRQSVLNRVQRGRRRSRIGRQFP